MIRPGARTLGRTGARARVGAYFARDAIFDRTTKQTRTPNMTFANSQFPNFLLFNTLGGQEKKWCNINLFGKRWVKIALVFLGFRSVGAPAFWGAKKTSPHYNQQAAEPISLDNIQTTTNKQQNRSPWTTSEAQPTSSATTGQTQNQTTHQPPETPNNTPTKIQPQALINTDLLKNLKKKYTLNY